MFDCWPETHVDSRPALRDAAQATRDASDAAQKVDKWTVEMIKRCYNEVISEEDAISMRKSNLARINVHADGASVFIQVDAKRDIFFDMRKDGKLVSPPVSLDSMVEMKKYLKSRLKLTAATEDKSLYFSPNNQGVEFREPFEHAGLVRRGPTGTRTSAMSMECAIPSSKRKALLIGGETGSGKTVWSTFILPHMIGAANGILYYSCKKASETSEEEETFERDLRAVEVADPRTVANHGEFLDFLGRIVWGRVESLGEKCVQAYTHLRDTIKRRMKPFRNRDQVALTAFYTLAAQLFKRESAKEFRTDGIPDSITNIIVGLTKLANGESWKNIGSFRKLTETASFVLVIDEAGRCPGFVRSVVSQCRDVYFAFQYFFNIQLVIAFCGTGTEFYEQRSGIFRAATDPSCALRVKVLPGSHEGLDFANDLYAAGISHYGLEQLSKEFPTVETLPLKAPDLWTNARLTVEFLAAFLGAYRVRNLAPMDAQCHTSLVHTYKWFLQLNGIGSHPLDTKRTLINVAYWTLTRNIDEPEAPSLLAPEPLQMTPSLEDGLYLVGSALLDNYDAVSAAPTRNEVTKKQHLLFPGKDLSEHEKAVLNMLQEMCVSVGLLSVDSNTKQLTASAALQTAIACGFQAPQVRKGDGVAFKELVSIAVKRTAEVGGFATTIVRLKVPFPRPVTEATGGLDVTVDVAALHDIVTALQDQIGGREEDATYVGTAVIVINGPDAPSADIIKICRVHGTGVTGAQTSVTFYDVKHKQAAILNDFSNMQERALTSAACELNGATHDIQKPVASILVLRSSFARAVWLEVAAAKDAAALDYRLKEMAQPGYIEPAVDVRLILQDSLIDENLPGIDSDAFVPPRIGRVMVRRQHLRHLGVFSTYVVRTDAQRMEKTVFALAERECSECLAKCYLYPDNANYKCQNCRGVPDED
jgi:hypothetical protein